MNKIKIVSDKGITKTFLDDKEIEYVKSIKFEHKAEEIPTVTIELYTDSTGIYIDKAMITKNKVPQKRDTLTRL